MIRKFSLKNSFCACWDLNDKETFFMNPDGLGFRYKTVYKQIGNIFVRQKEEMEQKEISGEIRFSTYEKYREFCLFAQHKPFVLEYGTQAGSYHIDVDIEMLEKTELQTGGLFCSIRFLGLSSFYKIVSRKNDGSMVGGKVYPYSYNYRYSDYSTGVTEIESDSMLDSGTKITLIGPCTNPAWTHYLNGRIINTGKVNCTIKAGNRLVVDNTKIPFEIAEYDVNGTFVQNLYQESDFSTERFVSLGYGNNKIVFSHEGENPIVLIVEGKLIYESV